MLKRKPCLPGHGNIYVLALAECARRKWAKLDDRATCCSTHLNHISHPHLAAHWSASLAAVPNALQHAWMSAWYPRVEKCEETALDLTSVFGFRWLCEVCKCMHVTTLGEPHVLTLDIVSLCNSFYWTRGDKLSQASLPAARPIIHFANVFASHKGSGIGSVHDMVCGTKSVPANRSRVPPVGRALGDCKPLVTLPTSHARFLWLAVLLSGGVQRQFCRGLLAPLPEMKRLHRSTSQILSSDLGISLAVPGHSECYFSQKKVQH